MTRDLSSVFPHPLPCIAVEQWTGLDGWFEYRVILLGSDERETLCVEDNHSAAVKAAMGIAKSKGLPFADLSKDDY